MAERRKLERNLHDGAQPRLLALAFQLQAAQINGDADRPRDAVAEGVQQAHAAVVELRALANGLHPAVLTDGGLAAALDDLVERTAIEMAVAATEARFTPEVEAAAWFIVCEAVTNARKHSGAAHVDVEVTEHDGWLDLSITDDGRGGADATGGGLQGIRDRAEAAGGSLEIRAGSARARRYRAPPVRAVIADDSVLLWEGLGRLLAEAGIEPVAMVGDAGALEDAVAEHRPDVALVDIRMPPTYTHEGALAASRLRTDCPSSASSCPHSPWRRAMSPSWSWSIRPASATCSRIEFSTWPRWSTRSSGSSPGGPCSTPRSSAS